jgi:hypothetical protein
VIALKFLRGGAIGPFSGVRWAAPASGAPGAWVQATGDAVCTERVHACRTGDLPEWIDAELWTVELEGAVAVQHGKLVADRGRLLARIEAWNPASACELATACALRARDAAVAVLGPGPHADALSATAGAGELLAATAAMTDHEGDGARAAAYAGDAARHAVAGAAEPATAPGHAATAAFIAAHAAALAAGDVGAAETERAWQARWLAQRLALTV